MKARLLSSPSALALGVLLALNSAATVWAQPPVTVIIVADSSFVNDFDCAFPLQEQVTGSVRDTLFYRNDGTLEREFISPQFQGPLTVSWTNLATGTRLSSHEASPLTVYYNPDGSFQSIQNRGLTFHVSVPHVGQLLLDVGRIVIKRGQGITFEAGPHQELDGDTAAFCAYLAQ